MPGRNYDDFDAGRRPNAIERDRMERRRQLRRKSMMTNIFVVAIALVVVAGIIIAIAALTGKPKVQENVEPSTVTATIAAETPQTPTASPTQDMQNNAYATDSEYQNSSQEDEYTEETYEVPTYATEEVTEANYTDETTADSGAGVVSGPLYYSAAGQTSYGYDWTYSGGGGVVDVSCDYDFDNRQYNFTITGVSEGTATITLYYNTDDAVQQSVNMTVEVDSNLNVLQIG